jgi:hypothetical protein
MTLDAPMVVAESAAMSPTGPAPKMTMDSPGSRPDIRTECQPVGNMSESIV